MSSPRPQRRSSSRGHVGASDGWALVSSAADRAPSAVGATAMKPLLSRTAHRGLFLPVGLFCHCLADCVACRVPPRRAGNFHLLVQMKVTKAKDPNATPLSAFCALRNPGPAGHLETPWRITRQRTRRRGPRNASPALIRWTQGQSAARPRRVRCWTDERRSVQVARRAGQANREERTERFCIEPLCFGDFHLGPQMKVTRPPGRDPAGRQSARHRSKLTRSPARPEPCMQRSPQDNDKATRWTEREAPFPLRAFHASWVAPSAVEHLRCSRKS
jgi:hypothetical protein